MDGSPNEILALCPPGYLSFDFLITINITSISFWKNCNEPELFAAQSIAINIDKSTIKNLTKIDKSILEQSEDDGEWLGSGKLPRIAQYAFIGMGPDGQYAGTARGRAMSSGALFGHRV
ncbi:hypothetical protein HUJ05_013078 [Dendroctonus ponderosae]|nr:hypothetical protein HUJ05_013078 [Dendroctonus ponderosae]